MKTMKTKKLIMIIVGVLLILLSLAAMITGLVKEMLDKLNDQIDRSLIGPVFLFLYFPVLLEEISLFISAYRLIFSKPEGAARICCITAVILVSCALIFQILSFANVINYKILPDGPKAATSLFTVILLLTEWPVVIISFILGCVGIKIDG